MGSRPVDSTRHPPSLYINCRCDVRTVRHLHLSGRPERETGVTRREGGRTTATDERERERVKDGREREETTFVFNRWHSRSLLICILYVYALRRGLYKMKHLQGLGKRKGLDGRDSERGRSTGWTR